MAASSYSGVSHPELWAKIQSYAFPDKEDGASFAYWVATDTGMTTARALQAIDEYRKFAYLCTISSRRLVPSKIVDEVWHLHLTHTQDYWGRFCPDVLGKELHHVPGRSTSQSEDEAFTRELYEREFGQKPPYHSWPRTVHKVISIAGAVWAACSIYGLVTQENGNYLIGIIAGAYLAYHFGDWRFGRGGDGGCSGCGGD